MFLLLSYVSPLESQNPIVSASAEISTRILESVSEVTSQFFQNHPSNLHLLS